MKHILNIIKDSNHGFSLFDKELIEALEQKITIKDGKFFNCWVDEKIDM